MAAPDIARVVIAVSAAMTLAVLGAHPRVIRWERRFGLTVLATSGFPFLLLGVFFRELGVLTADVLRDLRPLFEFGLGWVGLTIGTQLDLRRFDRLPPSAAPVIALASLLPIVFAAIACSFTLAWLGAVPGKGLIRDGLILMACAAVSAPANLELLLGRWKESMQLVLAVTRIDQLAALAILAVVAIMFRPDRTVTLWHLPRSGWFLMTLGLGAVLGILVYILVRNARENERLALLLGGVALSAGMAGYLALAVPVVCAIAGAVLTNFPMREREPILRTLRDVERPLYFLFLFILGASWRPDEWEGWLLGLVFAASRTYGKIVAVRIATWHDRTLPPWKPLAVSLLPESTIAIVVLFSATAIDGASANAPVRWAVNAVIVGSVLTEVAVQWYQRRERRLIGEETLA